METHYMEVTVVLILPDGETPTINVGWNAGQKIQAALNEVLDAGAATYDFTVDEITMDGDMSGIVLTYEE